MDDLTEREYPPYNVMIKRLFKTMPDVPHASLMHAAIGLAGEAAELMMSRLRKNTIEECGDMEFYIEAAKQQFKSDIEGALTLDPMDTRCAFHLINASNVYQNLVTLSGDILDVVKKSWVYGNILDTGNMTKLLLGVEHNLDVLYEMIGVTKGTVCHLNQVKLIGPGGRYQSGFYSDDQALERKDKVPGEDRVFFGKSVDAVQYNDPPGSEPYTPYRKK